MPEEKKEWKNNGISWKPVTEKSTKHIRPNGTIEKNNSYGKGSITASNIIVKTLV